MPSLLKNLGLSAASLAFLLVMLELMFAFVALPLVPLKLHAALPRGIRPLAQSSKAGIVPRDYVALLGDSHAQGAGDWMLTSDHNRNPPFHSAHLIQQGQAHDVLSLGVSGAGSLRALVTEPITTLDYLKRTAFYPIADPDQFVFYFYEGNDVSDNVRDLELRFDPDYDRGDVRDPVVFRQFVDEVVIGRSRLAEESGDFTWLHNFNFTRTVWRGLAALTRREWPKALKKVDWSIREVNEARIGGASMPLPDGLQSPALELTDDELELGLWVFERAFEVLREHFPHVPTLVVYLPSPLSTYVLTSAEVSVQLEIEGRPDRYPASRVSEHSDRICADVSKAVQARGADFVDARRSLWPLAEREPVHGPLDWKHFNRRGQQALADAVVSWLETGAVAEPGCVSVAGRQAATSQAPAVEDRS